MKYKDYETDYVKCPECGGFIDQDSLMCRKCGFDCEKVVRNAKSYGAKNNKPTKKYY
jgi:translation initiation factor 2 beta subunit (eIF-2beta)/eIF-5